MMSYCTVAIREKYVLGIRLLNLFVLLLSVITSVMQALFPLFFHLAGYLKTA